MVIAMSRKQLVLFSSYIYLRIMGGEGAKERSWSSLLFGALTLTLRAVAWVRIRSRHDDLSQEQRVSKR